MRTERVVLAGLVVVIISAVLFAVNAERNENAGENALVGSWKVRVNAVTGPPAHFDELITFSPGGGILESNNFPFFQSGLTASAGHGTWHYTGKQTFSFTFVKFLYTTTGQSAGTLKVVGTITYTPGDDTWSGPATVSMCNPADVCNLLGTTDGKATRIVAPQ